jgi:hypothetical protein
VVTGEKMKKEDIDSGIDNEIAAARREFERIAEYVYITNGARMRIESINELIDEHKAIIAELQVEAAQIKMGVKRRKKYNLQKIQKQLEDLEKKVEAKQRRNKKNLLRLAQNYPGGLGAICKLLPNHAKGAKRGVSRQALYAEMRRGKGALTPRHERQAAQILGVGIEDLRK